MDFSKLGGMVGTILTKENGKNPVVMLILSQFSTLLSFAAGLTEHEAHAYVRVSARLILNLEWKLRQAVNASETQYDDAILNEFVEACREVEPGYVPVVLD